MADIKGKVLKYKGEFSLNLATSKGVVILKKNGEDFTTSEVDAISEQLLKEILMEGAVVLLDKGQEEKPKRTISNSGSKEAKE